MITLTQERLKVGGLVKQWRLKLGQGKECIDMVIFQ